MNRLTDRDFRLRSRRWLAQRLWKSRGGMARASVEGTATTGGAGRIGSAAPAAWTGAAGMVMAVPQPRHLPLRPTQSSGADNDLPHAGQEKRII